MSNKRALHQDPEYEEIPAEIQEKRIKLMEDNTRNDTRKKIENIIKTQFEQEKALKKAEILSADDELRSARSTLDRLRSCIIVKFYSSQMNDEKPLNLITPSIHPTIRKFLGRASGSTVEHPHPGLDENPALSESTSLSNLIAPNATNEIENQQSSLSDDDILARISRYKSKCKIIIGNISKFIPMFQREESDQSTHKWMIYVRGDKDNPDIEGFIKKVKFLLHPSYRPNDIVEISTPPFHLIKRGWGEFPVRVQLHFQDQRNKPLDIIHNLKLDKTYSGLQTLGAETVAELQLFRSDKDAITCARQLDFYSDPVASTSRDITSPCTPSTSGYASSASTSSTSKSSETLSSNSNSCDSTLTPVNELIVPDVPSPNCIDYDDTIKEATVVNHSETLVNGVVDDAHKPDGSDIGANMVNGVCMNKTEKSAAAVNDLNPTFINDSQQKIFLVPHTSILKISSGNVDASGKSSISPSGLKNKSVVNSYVIKVVPKQYNGKKIVFMSPNQQKLNTLSVPVIKDVAPNRTNNAKAALHSVLKPKTADWESKLAKIKLEYYRSFSQLLKRVCRIFPLIKENVEKNIFPFCASSIDEYLSWNVGKQRAAEWKRAGMIRSSIQKLFETMSSPYLSLTDIWSRREIMVWCRRHGFAPTTSEKLLLVPQPVSASIELSTLSDSKALLSNLSQGNVKTAFMEDEPDVEIVDDIDLKSRSKPHENSQLDCSHLPPLYEASSYVKESVAQIGIELKSVEIESRVQAPVLEDMILAACRELATDLLGEALNNGYDRSLNQTCPEEITVSDVYAAVKSSSQFDFLSNNYLGVPKGNT